METAYVLVKITHKKGLNPEDVIPRVEGGQNVKSVKLIEVSVPESDDCIPFISY